MTPSSSELAEAPVQVCPRPNNPSAVADTSVEILLESLSDRGVQLWVDGDVLRYRGPANALTAAMKTQLRENKSAIVAILKGNGSQIAPDVDARHRPFPLTDLQEAYCVGETDLYPLSTPAIIYYEFDVPGIELDRLNGALSAVIQQHDMLRVILLDDGRQVCPPANDCQRQIRYDDLRHLSPDEAQVRIDDARAAAGRQIAALCEGVPLECFVYRLATGYRLHLIFRLFCVDAHSIGKVLDDLVHGYSGLVVPVRENGLQFCDHVAELVRHKQGAAYLRSLEYWNKLAAELYPAPQLPLAPGAPPRSSRFGQLQFRLPPTLWKQFRKWCLAQRLSPGVALCAVYAEVLGRWSGGHPFSLTMMVGRRPPYSEWSDVVGNFASTLPLQVEMEEGSSFIDRVEKLQHFVHESLEHASVSAIEVLRIRRRLLNDSSQTAVPVVFASSLENEREANRPRAYVGAGWKLVTRKVYTPQVCLDHQVWNDGDALVCSWDFVEGMFPEGMIHEMFSTYCRNLEILASDGTAWNSKRTWKLPSDQLVARRAANATARSLERGVLHEGFSASWRRHAQRDAIITPDRTLTYADTELLTNQLFTVLHNRGLQPGELVAICMRKGWRQVVAVLSVVRAGGAYLPVDPELPPDRIKMLVERSRVRRIIVDDSYDAFEQASGLELCNIDQLLLQKVETSAKEYLKDSEAVAYVIYTSGSTGAPKGVAISHCAAVNTIRDVVQRFSFTDADRVLALSSLSFDLSVFDIFGLLSCGGSLVLPPYSASPDPGGWARCIEQHGVTVWNSVPALLELMIEFLGERAHAIINRLRLVMLSGDWIPLGLVQRLISINPSLSIVSLGGATEAAIWSNYFVIDQVHRSWSSVPYGAPLSNQRLHILDTSFRDSPTWVPNELYIAGEGLARGYHLDPERTNQSFVTHPDTGERLYKTGDYARYWADGKIEFLGRRDNQVKIGGFRIELGEIEAVLLSESRVRQVACIVHGVTSAARWLVAFVVPKKGEKLEADALRAFTASQLPSYMVPRSIVILDEMPLTKNGKVDRRRLQESYQSRLDETQQSENPRDEIENRLVNIWRDLCGRPIEPGDADFFLVGGTSLLAVRLVAAIREQFGVEISLGSLFANATLRKQGALIKTMLQTKDGSAVPSHAVCPIVQIRSGSVPLILIHPVGGNLMCYRQLIESIAPEIAIIGIQAISSEDRSTTTLADLATKYAAELLRLAPNRKVHLAGWSMGGVIALELFNQLERHGAPPASVTLIDSYQSAGTSKQGARLDNAAAARSFLSDLLSGKPVPAGNEVESLMNGGALSPDLLRLLADGDNAGHVQAVDLSAAFEIYKRNYEALLAYEQAATCPDVLLISANDRCAFPGLKPISMRNGHAKRVSVSADHYSIMSGKAVQFVGKTLTEHVLSYEVRRDHYDDTANVFRPSTYGAEV